jgi:pimeloyl-ACP methyl ester carboxylesterase
VDEREDVSFASGEQRCAAWLYRPAGAGPHPCVILAHGFGGTRSARLWAFAERFRDAGMAALVFDYRHFGDSEGEPRQLLSVGRQLDDWRAAIGYSRGLEGVDPDRIAIWGTSFGGGHVVTLAAEDSRIAAAVSQTPFASGPSALRAAGPMQNFRLTVAGLLDGLASIVGGEPLRIPLVAPPGRGAAMNQPGAYEGYRTLFDDPDRDFRNEFMGRAILNLPLYSPAREAGRVGCPLQVVVLPDDSVTPAGPARAMAAAAPRGELFELPAGPDHFAVYTGEIFERAAAAETDFLVRSLGLRESAAAA